ncbi:sulfatase-like hydrolase/transferase [Mariniblastus fucicola]|uniref:Arylsulfatase n=1 Tax=Mariniblastus fucicola TaxID=980251 RepID=A0A5B9P6E5_9BACT|nr:sulfatase-like hydrolase/transferase [Mariniblastus fucicola]QEG20226.1 Arylsulfatase [Mariniblastus fucicola]
MELKSVSRIRLVVCRSLLAFLIGVAVQTQANANEDAPRKPNIILIMADDVSWEAFGCYGAEDYKTPQIDRLAREGVRFTHCYSTPICTTSRVKIMTGKYNFRNYTHFGYLNPKEKTFGHMLQSAGYKTAVAGKWQLNGLYNSLPGHDDADRPHKAGFDEYMLWQLTTGKGGAKDLGGERFWSPPIEHNGKFLTKEMNEGKYGPDMFCEFICDFMERNKSEPFFVYYPMVLVHDPFVKTPDTIGDDERLYSANARPKGKAQKKKNFVAMVNYMDKIVGRVAKKVEDIGQAENTIILFTGDNGTNPSITSRWNGQNICGGKGGMKDMGTHVPLVAYWKGHTPKGVVLDDLVDFTDFYASFAEAAGVEPDSDDPIDGRSFLPQLDGRAGNPRDWVLCHYEPYWNKKSGQFVRNGNYKLYRDGRMFNVPDDLKEENDLSKSTDPQIRAVHDDFLKFLESCPPAPTGERAGSKTKQRPVYPDWKNLFGPGEKESDS